MTAKHWLGIAALLGWLSLTPGNLLGADRPGGVRAMPSAAQHRETALARPGMVPPGLATRTVAPVSSAGPAGPTAAEDSSPLTGAGEAPRKHTPIPLRPRSKPTGEGAVEKATAAAGGASGSLTSLVTVGSSLAMVLGLFFVVAWGFRRQGGTAAGALPKEVLEVLGRSTLPDRKQLQLLRLGHKLILVCNSPAGMEALSEIVDPTEVDRLAGLCQQGSSRSASASFRQVLDELGSQPHEASFLDAAGAEKRSSWFRTSSAGRAHA